MTEKEYKDLSVKEFTKAAEDYETDKAGIYEMCKADYPDILFELEKEPWDTLLDAGCGPAPMITLLSEKYPDRHYTGIDLTPKMIESGQEKEYPQCGICRWRLRKSSISGKQFRRDYLCQQLSSLSESTKLF